MYKNLKVVKWAKNIVQYHSTYSCDRQDISLKPNPTPESLYNW